MNLERFSSDLECLPQTLVALGSALTRENPWRAVAPTGHVLLTGMGSSYSAASALALRLRAAGFAASAVLSSTDLLPHMERQDTAIVISASGASEESVALARRLRGSCRVVAVTNVSDAPLQAVADHRLTMAAGTEESGVASRSYVHSLVLLLALVDHMLGVPTDAPNAAGRMAEISAQACADLLERSPDWLEPASDLLLGPDGTAFVAPLSLLCNAEQGALMLREVPRRPAIACETGDWSHIDVYLTKTTDYRMLLMSGSPWQAQALDWCERRGATVVALGAHVAGAQHSIRYLHDDLPDVRLVAEALVPSLLADQAWRRYGEFRTKGADWIASR